MLDARKALESLRRSGHGLPDDVLMPFVENADLVLLLLLAPQGQRHEAGVRRILAWRNRGCAIWDCRNTRFGNSVQSVRQTV